MYILSKLIIINFYIKGNSTGRSYFYGEILYKRKPPPHEGVALLGVVLLTLYYNI